MTSLVDTNGVSESDNSSFASRPDEVSFCSFITISRESRIFGIILLYPRSDPMQQAHIMNAKKTLKIPKRKGAQTAPYLRRISWLRAEGRDDNLLSSALSAISIVVWVYDYVKQYFIDCWYSLQTFSRNRLRENMTQHLRSNCFPELLKPESAPSSVLCTLLSQTF